MRAASECERQGVLAHLAAYYAPCPRGRTTRFQDRYHPVGDRHAYGLPTGTNTPAAPVTVKFPMADASRHVAEINGLHRDATGPITLIWAIRNTAKTSVDFKLRPEPGSVEAWLP